MTSEMIHGSVTEGPEEVRAGRWAAIGALIGFVVGTLGVTALGLLADLEAGSALGLGAFVGAWGGIGFGMMVGGVCSMASTMDHA